MANSCIFRCSVLTWQLAIMERNVTGGRGEVPVIAAAAIALTSLAALAAGRLRQGLCLFFQQLVQGFFRAASDQFLDLPL